MYRKAPLSSSFMLAGILGFFVTISFWIIGGKMSDTWGLTMTLFFMIVFVASLVSLRSTVIRIEIEKKPVRAVKVKKKTVKRKPVKKTSRKKVAKKRKKPAKKKR